MYIRLIDHRSGAPWMAQENLPQGPMGLKYLVLKDPGPRGMGLKDPGPRDPRANGPGANGPQGQWTRGYIFI